MKSRFLAVGVSLASVFLAGGSFAQTDPLLVDPMVWAGRQAIFSNWSQASRFSSMRLLAVRPFTLAADSWNTGSGNWSGAGNWTAGVPTSSSAVTIGNTSNGYVTEDLANASAGNLSILGSNVLQIYSGNALTVGGATSVSSGGYLYVGTSSGGGTLTSGGGFTNSGNLYLGNGDNTAASTLAITGTFTSNSGSYVQMSGGASSGGYALINSSGAAPSTLNGTYNLAGGVGAAAVEFGSGSINSISGSLTLNGSKAYMEVGPTNSNSALAGLNTINYNGGLFMYNGASATTTGSLTNNGGYLELDTSGSGGSTLNIGGSLTNTNTGDFYIGNGGMTARSAVNVSGTFNNSGGSVQVAGGSTVGATALLNVESAAPSSLAGGFNIIGGAGSAAMEFASGSINSISGSLTLNGSNAYLEAGPTNSNSALAGLNTINGGLFMYNGASATTTGPLTNNDGYLELDSSGSGGSTLNIGGSLTNSDTGDFYIGNGGTTARSTVNVAGTFNNSGASVQVAGGSTVGATALLNVESAAPSTLAGSFNIIGGVGSAAVEYASGSITNLTGNVYLNGPNAYMEVGATNSNSALASVNTLTNGGLFLSNGASLTLTGSITNNDGYLELDTSGSGGGALNVSGSVTNNETGYVFVGNSGMTAAATMKVSGSLTNTGSSVQVVGGSTSAATSLLNVSGAAPSTLNGTFSIQGNAGSAALEFGSGSITTLASGGGVYLYGANAYMEVGATNSNSALASVNSLTGGGLFLFDGASLTTTGAVTNNDGYLEVDSGGQGGSTLNIGGSLTNTGTGDLYVGNSGMTSPALLKVTGTLNNTDGIVQVEGGSAAADTGLLHVTGAAPATLTGTYSIIGEIGSAAVEFGSGKVTSIGDGASGAGSLELFGANAYIEVGATNSESALTGLRTINNNGSLSLFVGASLTTTGALTNSGDLEVDNGYAGGSSFTSKGALTNKGYLQVGNDGLSAPATLNTTAAFTNASTATVELYGGGTVGGNAVWNVTGPTISNSGTIDLNGYTADATMEIGANVTTSGAGAIKLSNSANNFITGSSSSFTLTNGSTIEGSGTISNLGIVNTGTISANQSTPLLILPSSAGLNNQGMLSVTSGDSMQIGTSSGGALTDFSGTTLTGGTYSVGGTLQFGASGTSIVTDAANISLTGAGAQIIDFGGNNVLKNLATITSAGSFTLGTKWGTFTTTGNFTNDGALSVGTGDKFIVDLSDSLTNFSGTTLTGGTYKLSGTLEFDGANIVTNDASISLTGTGAKILGKNNANGLANFAVNGAGASFTLGSKYGTFTTAGNFTNDGALTVGAGDSFVVNGNLTNFSSGTLNSGYYSVSGTLQFDGANIVTNSANLTLGSTTAKIVNQSNANALLGFTTNTSSGQFTLSGNASLSTTGGSFTNAGLFTVNSGSTFTVGGSSYNYTQTAGTTTVNGTLAGASAGSLSLNGGTLVGAGTLDYGVTDAATIQVGSSATATGELAVNGTYAQSTSGALNVTIGGTTAGTKYDQMNVSSTASLNGTLNITLAAGYTPAIGNTFDIINAPTISGSFSTINGLAINSSEHFSVMEINGDEIELTVVNGPAAVTSVSMTDLTHAGVVKGRYGRTVFSAPRRIALAAAPSVAAASTAPAFASMLRSPFSGRAPRPMDDLGPMLAPAANAGGTGAPSGLGISPTPPVNPMASMNHAYFECGVSLNALRHTGGKRMLKALWASPDSPDALNIGYMVMTTPR